MELPQFLIMIQEVCGELIQKYGVWGIAAGMMMESAGVPFASSVVLLTAGGMILSGRASFWLLLLASTAGIVLGSIISYLVGFVGGSIGRVVGNQVRNHRSDDEPDENPSRLKKVYDFIEKYGTYSIFAGQFWGVTRTFISFPAGAMHMNIFVFAVSTALGGAIFSLWVIFWSIVLTRAAGFLFKLFKFITSLSPWIWLVIFICLGVLIFYLYRQKR